MATYQYTKLAPSVYEDQFAVRAFVRAGDKVRTKRFPKGTPMDVIQRWRQDQKADARYARARRTLSKRAPLLPRDADGWCYLYVVAATRAVKIGRAVDPHRRLAELQTGHDEPLRLVAAVPVHASLEAFVHRRFAHLQRTGEWFELTDEIARFIEGLQAGLNPVLALWDCYVPVTPTDGGAGSRARAHARLQGCARG